MEGKNKNMCKLFVKTPLGKIRAQAVRDSVDHAENCPGIRVDLVENGIELPLVCVEYDSVRKRLKAVVCGNAEADEPSFVVLFKNQPEPNMRDGSDDELSFSVETPHGTIQAEMFGGSAGMFWPGVWVDHVRANGTKAPLLLAKYNPIQECIEISIYGKVRSDTPSMIVAFANSTLKNRKEFKKYEC